MNGVPLVTAAAGCGGTGPELARFGDLARLDATLIGPFGLPSRAPRAHLLPTPCGLVHTPAPVIPVERVISELLPWCAARALPVIVAVRGATTGSVVEILARLRRSLDFGTVLGVEIDLATNREGTRSSLGGLVGSDPDAPWSADPQGTLKLLSAAREQLPRDLLLMAKFGGECPDPVSTARAAVGGGARALVLSGSVPATGEGQWLAGPATAPITLGLLVRVRAAMAAARVPEVPLVAVGGVHDVQVALALCRAGADGVQVGSGILADPQVLWRVHEALLEHHDAPAPTDASTHAPVLSGALPLRATPETAHPDPGGPHDH